MVNRRLFIEYLLMVGIPLLLLWAVLHRGSTLQAPADVNGNWTIALSASPAGDTACEPLLRRIDGSPISISQSGSYLTADLHDWQAPMLKGRSEGSNLWLESAVSDDPVASSELLRLTGAVSTVEGSRLIHGALLMPRNMDCPPLAFQATWQSGNSDLNRIAQH